MRLRAVLLVALLGAFGAWGVLHAQKPFKEYPGFEYTNFEVPPDANVPHEWTRARLKYTQYGGGGFGRRGFGGGNRWTMDYPRSDRHLLPGIARLTRIDARSVEQVVELDNSDDIYNWPTLYGVEVGYWSLNDEEARQLREYLNRGGFLMVDDFHGNTEWEIFEEGIKKVFPDRDIVDLPDAHPIFHTLYDLDHRIQVPGEAALSNGVTYEQGNNGGRDPHWRGIYDNKGRVVVAICHNMDLGDAWEHADDAWYPAEMTGLAYRIAINYFVYDFTH
ncbi:MAG: DUF4159 domain-containing protein [Acidobacteriia bacterium]|nr:DUF4159 domain-containing protein [Terriglobia bacterium]